MNFMTSEMTRSSILVLGMHRSGTSMVAGLLSLLGLGLPKTLLPANEENPKGYFESPVFMDLNDRLLAAVESSWADWRTIEPRALADLQSSEAAGQIRAAVTAEFGSARMVVIKDPRICRLLPIWQTALGDLNFSSSAIIPYRSPAEVARSLNLRDGMTTAKGQMVWLRHSLDAELATRDMPRSFVSMPELIANPERILARIEKDIGIEWPTAIKDAKKKINEFVDTKLHRQKISKSALEAAGSVSHWVWSAFEAFEALKHEPGNLDAQKSLDDIRLAFDESQRLFGPIVEETRFAAETRKKVEADLEAAKRENQRLEALLKSTGSDIEGLVVDLDFKKDEISILRTQTEALGRQAAELEKSKIDAENRLGLEAELARTQRDKLESNFALYSEQSLGLAKSAAALLNDLPVLDGRDPRPDLGSMDLNSLSAFECYDLATRTIAAAVSEIRHQANERAALEAVLTAEKEGTSALRAELDSVAAKHLEAAQSLASAREEIELRASTNQALVAEIQASATKTSALEAVLNAERESTSALRVELDAVAVKHNEATESLASALEEIELGASRNQSLVAEIENCVTTLAELESDLTSARMLLDHAQNQIDALSASRDAVQRDRDDALSLIADLQRNIEDRDQQQKAANEAIEQAQNQIVGHVARQRELEAEKQSMAALLADLKQQRKSLTERNRASERKVERVRTMLEAKIGGMEARHAAELTSLLEKLSTQQQRNEALDDQQAVLLAAHARERQTLQERIEAAQQNAVAAERRGLDAVAIIEARFTALTAERERELGQRLDREMQKIAAERAQAQQDHAHQLEALAQAREEMKRENKRIEDEYYTTKLKLMLSEQDLAQYRAPFMRKLAARFVGKTRSAKLS